MTKNIAKNTSAVCADIIATAQGKSKDASGPVYMMSKHGDAMRDLRDRLNFNASAGISERATFLEYLGSQPEGEKLIASAAALKGKRTLDETRQKLAYDTDIKNSLNLLSRCAKVADVIIRLEDESFAITYRKNGAFSSVDVSGIDDDKATFVNLSAAQLLNMSDDKFTNLRKVGALPIKKGKSANVSKGGNGERIAPSKLGEAVRSIDTTIAGFDLGSKDNGLPPGAVMSAALLWARLDAELSADMKARAKQQYDAEADDAANATKIA